MPVPRTANQTNERIRRETQELHEQLTAVERTFARPASDAEELVGQLELLTRRMREHFDNEEERGGLFRQLVEDEPRVGHAVGELRLEHRQMLVATRRLMEQGRNWQASHWRETAKKQFEELHRRLKAHENRENDLLQEVYSQDIAAED